MRTGPDEADGAERPVDEPVAGADERDLAQRGMVELVADADERPARLDGRLAEHLEQRGALLDELEQVAVRLELLGAHVAEQVGGAADVQPLLGRDELGERRPKRGEERRARAGRARRRRSGGAGATSRAGGRRPSRSGTRPPTWRGRGRPARRSGRCAS